MSRPLPEASRSRRPGATSTSRAGREEPPIPPHPRLEPLLRRTQGMPLYEEDLMTLIAVLTGWPLERADRLRSDLLEAGDDGIARSGLEAEFVRAARGTGLDEH